MGSVPRAKSPLHRTPLPTTALLCSALAFSSIMTTSGCAAGWLPDGVSSGIVFREVRGRNQLDREELIVPLVRIEADKAITDTLDVRAWFDFINGKAELDSGLLEQDVRGDMQAGGVGLSYHPFTPYLSFDIGAEVFHADFAVINKPAFASWRVSESAYGWGLSAGLSTDIPITEHVSFRAAGGYMVTDNDTDTIHMDFDSFYLNLGVRVSW